METVTLELSPVEIRAMRAALVEYACTAYRRAVEMGKLGAYPRTVAGLHEHENAACALLGRLPQPRS